MGGQRAAVVYFTGKCVHAALKRMGGCKDLGWCRIPHMGPNAKKCGWECAVIFIPVRDTHHTCLLGDWSERSHGQAMQFLRWRWGCICLQSIRDCGEYQVGKELLNLTNAKVRTTLLPVYMYLSTGR